MLRKTENRNSKMEARQPYTFRISNFDFRIFILTPDFRLLTPSRQCFPQPPPPGVAILKMLPCGALKTAFEGSV